MTEHEAVVEAAPDDLSVSEAAILIGVSRARVYQRITGYAKDGKAGRPLDVVVRTTNRPGTRLGRQIRIPLASALAWRAERQASGLTVGQLHAEPPAPVVQVVDTSVVDAPVTDAPVMPAIGMPVF